MTKVQAGNEAEVGIEIETGTMALAEIAVEWFF